VGRKKGTYYATSRAGGRDAGGGKNFKGNLHPLLEQEGGRRKATLWDEKEKKKNSDRTMYSLKKPVRGSSRSPRKQSLGRRKIKGGDLRHLGTKLTEEGDRKRYTGSIAPPKKEKKGGSRNKRSPKKNQAKTP